MASADLDLFTAITKGQTQVVSKLLDQVSVNATKLINKVPYTPLMLAAELGRVDIVKMLVERNDVEVIQVKHSSAKKGLTPLHLAATAGQLPVVIELLKLGSKLDLNVTIERNVSPLQAAMMRGHVGIVDALWPFADFKLKQRCLNAALDGQKFEVVASLIEDRGMDVDVVYQDLLVLVSVAPYMDVKGLVYLLEKDLPISIEDDQVTAEPDHQFSWATFVDPSAVRLNDSIAKETVVDALVDAVLNSAKPAAVSRAQVMQALLASPDQHGRPVFALADASLVDFMKSQTYLAGRYEIHDGPPVHVSATSVIVEAVDHAMYAQVFDEYADADGVLNVDGFIDCNHVLSKLAPSLRAAEADDDDDDKERVVDEWVQAFDRLTPDNDCVDADDFRQFCERTYGANVKVAMKFLKHQRDHDQELQHRRGLCSGSIVGLLPIQADLSVLQSLRLPGCGVDLAEFPHVLVMPAGSRSLQDISLHERIGQDELRRVLKQIARSVQHLHDHNMMHGALTMNHVLRMHAQVKLIDFSAAVPLGSANAAGAKFSSGILPPEMFHQLQNDAERAQYAAYWRAVAANPSNAVRDWSALRPQSSFVVRSFCHSTPNLPDLPYSLVQASTAVDAWAFGCMVFELVTRTSLLPTNRHHDLLPDYVAKAATWTDESLRRRVLETVQDLTTQELLLQLLVVDPTKRLSMDQVLDHPFFTCPVDCEEDTTDDLDWMMEGAIAREPAKRNLLA